MHAGPALTLSLSAGACFFDKFSTDATITCNGPFMLYWQQPPVFAVAKKSASLFVGEVCSSNAALPDLSALSTDSKRLSNAATALKGLKGVSCSNARYFIASQLQKSRYSMYLSRQEKGQR